MRTAALAAAAYVLLTAGTSIAQEQTGRIEGIVQDQQQGVLIGVTVEARNLTVGSLLVVVTDAQGNFRFPALPPGYYDLRASRDGFRPERFERVEILLGQIKRLEFALAITAVEEKVDVSATSPQVDVKQSARAVSLRQDELQYLPRGVDYTSAVQLVPGANVEPKLGGLSIDGSSAAENRFYIDGIDTTDPIIGLPAQRLNVDAVDELQVKSSGYAAEFGGSTGGVVNVLTKSGANTWHGDGRFYFSGAALDAGPRLFLRRGLQDSTKAEYATYPEDPYQLLEPGFSVGGPINPDRAWFYVSYQPLLKHTDRTVTFALDGSSGTFGQDEHRHLITANQTLQLGSRFRTRASFNGAPTRTDGLLPVQAGTDSPLSNFNVVSHQPSWTASGTADLMASSRVFVSGRVGSTFADHRTDNVRAEPRYVFDQSNIGLLDVPTSLQRVTGFSTDTNNYDWARDRLSRLSTQLDATSFFTRWGEHAFKAGVQADWTTHDTDSGEKGSVVRLEWNRAQLGVSGRYGYYSVFTNSVDPRRGQIFIGRAAGSAAGLFVQDAWTMTRRLTVNVGLRTERETLPSYAGEGQDSAPIVQFGFSQKLAPRVGAAYDLRGDGRSKLYGSWGVFYDTFKYNLSSAFGGYDAMRYDFTLDTFNWPALVANPACPPDCPGTLIVGPLTQVNTPVDAVDPDLEPMRLQEAVAGVEHQVRPRLIVTGRYVHKQLDRAIDDIGARDASYTEFYTVGNPGYHRATLALPGLALPKAVRNYDALEFAVRRPLANGWAFNASYLWSRLYGNYSGLSESDQNGSVLPNIGRSFDYPIMMFDQKGQPSYGPLATDRPHQVKAQLIYATGFGLNVGAFQAVGSGIPVTRVALLLPPNNYPVLYLGRVSDGRMPVLSQTNLYVQQDITLSHQSTLSIGLSVTNVFDRDTALAKFPLETEDRGLAVDELDYYAGRVEIQQLFAEQGALKDPRFLMPRDFQAPRTARVMVRWSF